VGKGQIYAITMCNGNCYYESLSRINKAEESLSRCMHYFIQHAISP